MLLHTHTHTRAHTRMHTPIHTLIDARIRMHTLMHTDMHACANPVPHTGTEGCGTIRPWPLAICPFPWFHPTPTFKKQHCSVPVVKGKEQHLVDVDIWCYHVSALNAGSILLVLALFDVSAISAGNKYLVDVDIVWFDVNCVDMFDVSAVSAGSTLLTLFDVMFFGLMFAYIALFSALLSRLTALACGSTWVTSFIARFFF